MFFLMPLQPRQTGKRFSISDHYSHRFINFASTALSAFFHCNLNTISVSDIRILPEQPVATTGQAW